MDRRLILVGLGIVDVGLKPAMAASRAPLRSLAESVIASIRDIPGCSKLKVSRSHLIDSARWKEAGNRVVGIKKPRKPPTLKLRRV
jgi:hypothetical protein